MSLLCHLIVSDEQVIDQVVREAAASEHIIAFCTSALFSDSLLLTTDLLSLLTHVARARPEHLPFLQRILRGSDVADQPLTRLLGHRQQPVRAKTCSLLGNLLCRSPSFPQVLQSQPGWLESLLGCLSDSEESVRKAASFAVGNAAYHESSPAGTLGRAVPQLTRLLGDAQARTRCNAALALGNLGRHWALLGDLLMKSRAPHILLEVACWDPLESVREGALVALRALSQHPGMQQVLPGDPRSFVGPEGAALGIGSQAGGRLLSLSLLCRSCCRSEPLRSWLPWPAVTLSPPAPGRLLPGTARSSSASWPLCAAPATAALETPPAPRIPTSPAPRTSAEGRHPGSARRCRRLVGTNALCHLLGLPPRPLRDLLGPPAGTLPGHSFTRGPFPWEAVLGEVPLDLKTPARPQRLPGPRPPARPPGPGQWRRAPRAGPGVRRAARGRAAAPRSWPGGVPVRRGGWREV